MLKTSQNKWMKRKRSKTGTDEDDKQLCSPVKLRRNVQQNRSNDSSDERSDSDENDSGSHGETFVERGKAIKHRLKDQDKLKSEKLKEEDSSESDTDTDSESDVIDDEESMKQEKNAGLASSDNDDDDDDDSNSDSDNVLNKCINLNQPTCNKSVPGSRQLQSVIEKDDSEVSSSEGEDSHDSSENDDDRQVLDVDKEINLRTSSKAKIVPANEKQLKGKEIVSDFINKKETENTDNESSSSEDSSETDDDKDDEEEDKGEKDDLTTGTKSKDVPASKHGKSNLLKTENKSVGNKVNKNDSTSEDSDSSDSGDDSDVTDDDNPAGRDGNEGSDDAIDTDEENDDDGESELPENDKTEDEFAAVKKELANIPLEDLMKIKEKLGLKMFNRIMHGDKFEDKKQKVFKRANKNRPMEISSKKRVSVVRQAEVPKEKVRRDPRFDDLSGEFQDKHFMKNYSFLDDVKSKEKLLVQKKMKKTKDENKKKELEKLLNRMNQQEKAEKEKRHKLELEQQWKQKEKQLVKEGKTPYFLKKSDKKKLELAEKFKELQKSGKVDQYMSKRLKKNAKKEKKKLPGRHQRFM